MEKLDLNNYEQLLAVAGKFHGGSPCAGICIGTRMTMTALRRIGIGDPMGADRKKLIVFVEIDRCATDAIMALTGCKPGRRTMKVLDYGKMASTFINLETGKAVRVAASMKRKLNTGEGTPDLSGIPDEELFSIHDVEVQLHPEDMPGKPLRRVACARCGESVMDGRDEEVAGEFVCRPCATGQSYYRISN